MTFNHESPTHSHLFNIGKNNDLYYIQSDYKLFKDRYIKRINNFRNYIINNKTINLLFFQYKEDQSQIEDFTLLLSILNSNYKNKNFNIINI
jgi:hypothetical protein